MNQKQRRFIQLGFHISRGLVILSALFCLVVCVLAIANYIRFGTSDPSKDAELAHISERLTRTPEDEELTDKLEDFEQVIKDAYHSKRLQLRIGMFLLAGGAIVLLAGSFFVLILRRMQAPAERLPTILFVAAGGMGLIVIALLFTFLSHASIEQNQRSTQTSISSLKAMLKVARDRRQIEAESIVYENYLAADELKTNWPSFRGPGGIGIAPKAKPPTTWNGATGDGVLWKTEVPKPGNNSPIVWDDRLFLSGADETIQEIYCFDRFTGKILWTQALKNIPGSPSEPPAVSRDTGYAPSTMATDGSRVFAIFPTGDAVCFDFDGNQIWGRNLGLPENHYGHASSLITYRGRLVVQYDQDKNARIMALKSDSGETLWEKKRHVPASWASPSVVYTGKRPEIILNANPIVASYNAETGREMWHVDCMNGEVGPSAAYEDGIAYAVCQNWMLAAIDVSTHRIIWEVYDDLPDAASPVAAGGLVFLPTAYGAFSCLDGKTGQVYWMYEFSEGSYASPIWADGRIYWTDQTGITHIFKAEREFDLIADAEIGQKCQTTAAFVGTRIYLRGETHLFCIAYSGK